MKEFIKSTLFLKLIVVPFIVFGIALVGIIFYLQSYGISLAEKRAVEYTKSVLHSYERFSKDSIEKGQRKTFQDVVDSIKKIDGVQKVYGYSRDGFLKYMNGEKSVGMTFLKQKGKFVNPNIAKYNETKGMWIRDDWYYSDTINSKIGKMMKQMYGNNCAKCHYMKPKNLHFKNRVAIQEENNNITAFYNIKVEPMCIKCHTHWKTGESAGYLGIQVDTTKEKEQIQKIIGRLKFMLLILSLLGLILGIYYIYVVGGLRTNLLKLKEITLDLAHGDGDLTKRVNINSKDETKEIANNLNIFIEKIQNIVKAASVIAILALFLNFLPWLL